MKRLERLTLKEVGQEMMTIPAIEAQKLKGGDGSYFVMAGGVVVNYGGYSVYYQGATLNADGTVSAGAGSSYYFDGVNVSGCTICASDSAYQLNGQINVGSGWGSSFTVNDLVHEYGHYLQQQEMGTADYLINVAIPSMGSNGDPSHSSQPYEQDATQRGNTYMQTYYPGYY